MLEIPLSLVELETGSMSTRALGEMAESTLPLSAPAAAIQSLAMVAL